MDQVPDFLWTSACVDRLEEERGKRTPSADIAVILSMMSGGAKVTRNMVIGKAYRLGMPNLRRPNGGGKTIPETRTRNPFQVVDDGVCLYPIGHPRDADFRFCMKPVSKAPFCEAHRKLCYMKVKPEQDAELLRAAA